MSGVEIDVAGVASLPADMVDLTLVSMMEEQSTEGTASALPFAQGGPSRTDGRGLPASFTPLPPIPVVRTPLACDVCVSQTGGVTMGGEGRLPRTGGWRGKHLAGCPSGPVPVNSPPCRFVGVSPACPGAQRHPGESIQAPQGRLTSPGALVIGPTAYFGVALVDQGRWGPVWPRPHDATPLRKLFLHIGLGRCHQGFVPETLIAPGSFPRLVLPHPIVTEGATKEVHSRVLAFSGGAQRRFADVQCQPDLRQPCRQELLTVLESGASWVEHQAVIGVSDNTRFRRALGDGLVQAMHSHQREERRTATALRCPCHSGHARVRCDEPCTSPRAYLPTEVRWRLEFGQ